MVSAIYIESFVLKIFIMCSMILEKIRIGNTGLVVPLNVLGLTNSAQEFWKKINHRRLSNE